MKATSDFFIIDYFRPGILEMLIDRETCEYTLHYRKLIKVYQSTTHKFNIVADERIVRRT
jgi:hypothetical protein